MRVAPILLLALLCAGCVELGFHRPPTLRESLRRSEIKEYYEKVQLAFAQGNAAGLAALFDSGITKPMTHAQIVTWGEKFFGENGPARFRIIKLSIDSLGTQDAKVTMEYKVETEDGKGDFGGTELDTLKKSRGRWLMTAWEKVP